MDKQKFVCGKPRNKGTRSTDNLDLASCSTCRVGQLQTEEKLKPKRTSRVSGSSVQRFLEESLVGAGRIDVQAQFWVGRTGSVAVKVQGSGGHVVLNLELTNLDATSWITSLRAIADGCK